MLEDKLMKIRDIVKNRLDISSAPTSEIVELVHEGMREEGILPNHYDSATFQEQRVSVRTAISFYQLMGAKEYPGVKNKYLSLEEEKLTPSARTDVNKRKEVIAATTQYLRKEIKGRELHMKEFMGIIADYLKRNTDVEKYADSEYQVDNIKLNLAFGLQNEFGVKEDLPEDPFNAKSVYATLDKILKEQ